ncbi:hypothetical protein ABZ622_39085 [Streptomyces sp. NPDC007164]|uniref:LexA family protein n=1 Tax=Streptomyces sp. NPDC007164 TaxID=3156918 RepID=UPI0033FFFB66
MPLSAPPTSYTAAVERYLTGAGIATSSARVYRISLTTWGSPSVRQIGEGVGLSSTSSVAYQLDRLEARGPISRTGRRWRA